MKIGPYNHEQRYEKWKFLDQLYERLKRGLREGKELT